jgi:hypothetical protein
MCFYDFIGVHCVSKISRAAGGGVEKVQFPLWQDKFLFGNCASTKSATAHSLRGGI